jgi:protein-disulfide isomerase
VKTGPLSRREWLGLGAVSLGALAVGQYLRTGQPIGRDVSEIMDVPALLNAPGFPFEGPPGARVTMLAFSDYACPVCRQVEPLWRKAVRASGEAGHPVRVVHRDWPILGPDSITAARMALAAGRQGAYAQVHEVLMRTGQHDEAAIRQALTAAGGDWEQLLHDLAADAEAIDRLLAKTAQDAFQLGFPGTPGYLIGPIRIAGGASERQFAAAIGQARDA